MSGEPRIVDVVDSRPDTRSWHEVLDLSRNSTHNEQTLDLLTPGCDEVIEIIFTSGTTGQPKGVLHTINTLTAAVVLRLRDASQLSPRHR